MVRHDAANSRFCNFAKTPTIVCKSGVFTFITTIPSCVHSNTVLGRYKYEGGGIEKGECGLRIQEINEDEDLGKWTCVARLQGRITEGYDVITLTTNGMLTDIQLPSP